MSMMTGWKTDVTRAALALAVSLIAADGVIEDEEKEVAIAVGRRMLPGFSQNTFELLLGDIDELPSAYELAAPLRRVLDDEDKDLIMDYLVAVAGADREVVEVEAHELEAIAQALGVPMPAIKVSPPHA
jgi:uncharacterized tellurite resistance protein B-like protein